MKIGVADSLYLSDILYKNVIFRVFADEKLTFQEHTVNGTIGFPEIKALGAIKIHKNNVLEIFNNEEKQKNNMMFSGTQQMIISANDSLLFVLDTGAAWSNLSFNYYSENKEVIDRIGNSSTKIVSGMGGSENFSVYELKDYQINISSSKTILPKIDCFTQPTSATQYEYDGYIGQDIIKQYDYMLLDFKNMCFSLENTEQSE